MSRVLMVGLAALLGFGGYVHSGEKTGPAKETYLGLKVEKVPQALHSQLPALPKGEGLLIDQVTKGSPAEKSGLQANDILVSFNDQKITSPEQLVKLVRHEKSGKEVSVGLIRAGKSMTSKVTLAETKMLPHQDNPRIFRFTPDKRMSEAFKDFDAKTDGSGWKTFDAMKLTRTDDTHWRAEIEYRDTAGKKESRVFTGTREEIRKDIMGAKDLPTNERTHLLRALNLHDPVFEFHFPAGWMIPNLSDSSGTP